MFGGIQPEAADAKREALTAEFSFMQDLALRHYNAYGTNISPEEANQCVLAWTDHNEGEFPALFHTALKEHPKLLDFYKKDPEAALVVMEEYFRSKKIIPFPGEQNEQIEAA